MGKKFREILGIPIDTREKGEILEEIEKYLKKVKSQTSKVNISQIKPLEILTPNPEIIAFSLHDRNFFQIVRTAQMNIPDGSGVVWAMNFLYGENVSKIPGIDFLENLVAIAMKERLTVGLIGGRGKVALQASECLKQKYPGLSIEVFEEPEVIVSDPHKTDQPEKRKPLVLGCGPQDDGERKKYFENLATNIREKAVRIVFVGLGFPKQEYFIRSLSEASAVKNDQPLLLMAVGGSFDIISGKIPRAADWMKRGGIEWIFRLIIQPWRLGRQMKGIEFFYRVVKARK